MKRILTMAVLLAALVMTAGLAQASTDGFYVTVTVDDDYTPSGDAVDFRMDWLEHSGSGTTVISYHITEYGKGKKVDTVIYDLILNWHGLPDVEPEPYDATMDMSWTSVYTDGTPVAPGHYEVHVSLRSEIFNPVTGKWIRNSGTATDDFYLA